VASANMDMTNFANHHVPRNGPVRDIVEIYVVIESVSRGLDPDEMLYSYRLKQRELIERN